MKTLKYLSCVAFLALSGSALAFSTSTFVTGSGATDSAGEPVSAQAIFSITQNDLLTITLTNLQVNQTSAGQLVSDLFFTLSNVTTGGSLTTSSGTLRTVAKGGTFTDSGTGLVWKGGGVFTVSGGVFHLNGLNGGGKNGGFTPAHLLIGPPDGSGVYSNANGSIAGNTAHNPFIAGDATFVLNIPGINTNTFVTSATFSFGTAPGDTGGGGGHCISGCGENAPDGGTTSLLLGFALTGLGVIRRYFKG